MKNMEQILKLKKMSKYVVFSILTVFFGCTNNELEMVNVSEQESQCDSLLTRTTYENDIFIDEDGREYELVDGFTLNMSITTVLANYVTQLFGTVRFPTVENGKIMERPYEDEKYHFSFVGRRLYEGKDQIIEEPLPVYPINRKVCLPADRKDNYVTLLLQIPSSIHLDEGEISTLYIRYILSYIDDKYRYGKLENSNGQYYFGAITLPINTWNYDIYIAIDDFRISDSSGQWGPRFW